MARNSLINRFSMIPKVKIGRSRFDRSHEYKTTFDSGYLIPFFVDEVLPGDTFTLDMSALVRMATPIYPIMDNLYLDSFYFFVPCRLVWDNFQRMMGERDNPDDSIDYIVPTIATTDSSYFESGSIFDYFGLPTNVSGLSVNALPLRAYNLIYNEWFRDENLIDSLDVPKGDGPDDLSIYSLQRRAKTHDYFTSCLPWPQKGEGVSIPLGGTIPISATGDVSDQNLSFDSIRFNYGGTTIDSQVYLSNDGNDNYDVKAPDLYSSGANYVRGLNGVDLTDVFNNAALTADLSSATVTTIDTLREAFALQSLLEADARGGSRYTEILRAHFGVVSPDARLQRPEYLGGSSTRINVTPVVQQSSTDEVSPQGNLSAYAAAALSKHCFSKSFVEHGYIIGLCNVRAENTYQQGLNRMWSRSDRYDFYWPEFAHLGEQEVLNKEIYAQGTDEDEGVFGYQERYAEYRYKPSIVTGAMRSNYSKN